MKVDRSVKVGWDRGGRDLASATQEGSAVPLWMWVPNLSEVKMKLYGWQDGSGVYDEVYDEVR